MSRLVSFLVLVLFVMTPRAYREGRSQSHDDANNKNEREPKNGSL